MLILGLQTTPAGARLPTRRLTFVPAVRPDAHSAPPGADLVTLNDPDEVRRVGDASWTLPQCACVPVRVCAARPPFAVRNTKTHT